MNTKLTLRLDERLIRNAKRHAGKSGKSVSKLVADYFALIEADEDMPGTEATPRVRSLIGSLKGAAVTEADYRRHLDRELHVDVAAKLLALVDNRRVEGSICVTTATTIYHIAAKSFGRRRAHAQVHAVAAASE